MDDRPRGLSPRVWDCESGLRLEGEWLREEGWKAGGGIRAGLRAGEGERLVE
jgi:hypothetical protein